MDDLSKFDLREKMLCYGLCVRKQHWSYTGINFSLTMIRRACVNGAIAWKDLYADCYNTKFFCLRLGKSFGMVLTWSRY